MASGLERATLVCNPVAVRLQSQRSQLGRGRDLQARLVSRSRFGAHARCACDAYRAHGGVSITVPSSMVPVKPAAMTT